MVKCLQNGQNSNTEDGDLTVTGQHLNLEFGHFMLLHRILVVYLFSFCEIYYPFFIVVAMSDLENDVDIAVSQASLISQKRFPDATQNKYVL